MSFIRTKSFSMFAIQTLKTFDYEKKKKSNANDGTSFI